MKKKIKLVTCKFLLITNTYHNCYKRSRAFAVNAQTLSVDTIVSCLIIMPAVLIIMLWVLHSVKL